MGVRGEGRKRERRREGGRERKGVGREEGRKGGEWRDERKNYIY